MATSDQLIIIDVREPDEHERFNIGGTNIPVTELPFRIHEVKQLGEGDIVLYCQSGNRSALAQRLLASQFNIHHTLNLTGGMIRWKDEIGDGSV
jgi:rhodanese-related sulfurtransferase